ncbi:hypothetical protein B0H16DRAFT_1450055 [Mycena metata]|uniref:Uncharacterized protein n=1 Tax=Mycena metata TaxID=1033252 RepID=A0AAD7JZY0_9AGAR|nr:hypothetical protein B0H16DRAFT_1450055 [Mycena metata]
MALFFGNYKPAERQLFAEIFETQRRKARLDDLNVRALARGGIVALSIWGSSRTRAEWQGRGHSGKAKFPVFVEFPLMSPAVGADCDRPTGLRGSGTRRGREVVSTYSRDPSKVQMKDFSNIVVTERGVHSRLATRPWETPTIVVVRNKVPPLLTVLASRQVTFCDLPNDTFPKCFCALWNPYAELIYFLVEVPKSFSYLMLAEYPGRSKSQTVKDTPQGEGFVQGQGNPLQINADPVQEAQILIKHRSLHMSPPPAEKKHKHPLSPTESESGSKGELAPKSTRGRKAKVEKEDVKGKGKSKATKDEAEYVNQSEASESEAEEVEAQSDCKCRFLDPPMEYNENRPEAYRELKEALKAKMSAHKGTGDQVFHFNLDQGEDSPYITIVRKENSYTKKYYSQLVPEDLMSPNPGQPYLLTQAPFLKIPLEELTELEWPNTAICIPTVFGGPCASCTRYRFRRCDHHKSIETLTSMFAEMSVLYTAVSDVTGSVITQASASFVRANRAREAYDHAQQEAHAWFRHLIKHVMHCIATVGLTAFQEHFVREESDPLVSDALQVIIDRYNAHVEAHGSPDALRLPLSVPEDLAKSDTYIPLFTRGGILQEISMFTEMAMVADNPMDEDGNAPPAANSHDYPPKCTAPQWDQILSFAPTTSEFSVKTYGFKFNQNHEDARESEIGSILGHDQDKIVLITPNSKFASYILEDCKVSLKSVPFNALAERHPFGPILPVRPVKRTITSVDSWRGTGVVNHAAWTSFLVSPDFRTSDRKFRRDEYSVDDLKPWFDRAFQDNLGYSIRRLELICQHLNGMEDKEEIHQLLAKWILEGYYALAIEHVQNRFLTPAPRCELSLCDAL